VLGVEPSAAPGTGSRVGDIPEEPGLCLEVTAAALEPGAWPALLATVVGTTGARPDLFPEPMVLSLPDPRTGHPREATSLRIGAWSTAGTGEAVAARRQAGLEQVACLAPGATWSARITFDLLRAGADRRAATVALSPGTTADVDVSFHPAEARVRTFLDFELPLGIGGTCWLDDVLSVNGSSGRLSVASTSGMDVTLFAEYGCERFMALMPDGGAGEQAIGLVPGEIVLDDATTIPLAARQVTLDDLAVLVTGGSAAP
jgi:hypothetical protein